MEPIGIASTGIETTKLGFGGAALTFHDSSKTALEFLHLAFDHGVRHFDTAPLYGSGRGEKILGKFLTGRRIDVTIATKFGFKLSWAAPQNVAFVATLKKIVKNFPLMERLAKRQMAGLVTHGAFSPKDAEESLHASLKRLRTDYVDVFLLHECLPSQSANEDLIACLGRLVESGKVRACGLATNFKNLPIDLDDLRGEYKVVQFENSLYANRIPRFTNTNERCFVNHSIFRELPRLIENVTTSKEQGNALSKEIGCDLNDCRLLAEILLVSSKYFNANGITLFSTTSKDHLLFNLRAWEDSVLTKEQISTFRKMTNDWVRRDS